MTRPLRVLRAFAGDCFLTQRHEGRRAHAKPRSREEGQGQAKIVALLHLNRDSPPMPRTSQLACPLRQNQPRFDIFAPMPHNTLDLRDSFDLGNGQRGQFYSLPKLEEAGAGKVSRLPVSIRIVLESVLRNVDGRKITERDVRTLANWQRVAEREDEIPFMVARVLLQDFTGVPLLVDLAAMRSAAARAGKDPRIIEPLVPVDLVIDHSVQVDYSSRPDALQLNMDMEFKRNEQRYRFLKWGTQAYNGFQVVPPGLGIVHQVNLEYLARGVMVQDGVWHPDTPVGTDSHTTMINGLAIEAWGVGGIEAEAGMLGQPVYFLTPDVIGVNLSGALAEGVTATDLVLTITEMLRKAKVVGKFVEYFGDGASSLSLADRATIANMAPEYGATMGYFPVDEETCNYLRLTGRTEEQIRAIRNYYQAQGLFGIPRPGDVDYTKVLELDLATVRASVAGPKRPQDRIEINTLKEAFLGILQASAPSGYGKSASEIERKAKVAVGVGPQHLGTTIAGGGAQHSPAPGASAKKNTSVTTEEEMINNRPTPDRIEAHSLADEFPQAVAHLHHGDVLIPAIPSSPNTPNPPSILAAGLLAKKAVEQGLRVRRGGKASPAPGSRAGTTPSHRRRRDA